MKNAFALKGNSDATENARLDAIIDGYLEAQIPPPSPLFADAVMAAARIQAQKDRNSDSLSDSLLSRLRDFPAITEETMVRLAEMKSSIGNSILAYSSAAAVAACAALAVFMGTANATLPRGVVSADDFAQMSKIDEEINGIAALVIQEEFIDLLGKKR